MSPVARHLALATGLGAGTFVLFLGLLGLSLLRRQPGRPLSRRDDLVLGAVPAAVAIALFFVGFRGYVDAAVAPADALELTATVSDWHWHFAYPSGNSSDDALRVPIGRPVHVTIVSPERIHRLEAPAVRAGAEAGPGADGSLWFIAREPGQTPLLCGPACSGHPEMVATLDALDDAGWRDFDDDGSKLPPAEYGAKLYKKSTCVTCHSLDGTPGTAPSFKGIFGKTETLADGTTVLVDEAYIRQSILEPTAKVVRGFQPVMPVFAGQLADNQIDALIAFIKSVKP